MAGASSSSSFGQTALSAAWLAGGLAFVALGLRGGSAERARFVRLGVVWGLFGATQAALASGWYPAWVDRRGAEWSRARSGLLGAGLALVSLGFVLSGRSLLWFGAGGLLLVAVAALADR